MLIMLLEVNNMSKYNAYSFLGILQDAPAQFLS
jgi:hypothetical protein